MPKNNPHKDHRQRVRKEFLENGFSSATPPHKVLEMLLFYSIPRKDTNEIAHALLDRFGSLSAVLEAKPGELQKVEGIGENSVALLKLMLPLFRIYEDSKKTKGFVPNSIDSVCDFVKAKYIGFTKEAFSITTFDSKGCLIAFDFLGSGDVSAVNVSTREVVSKVLERNAVSVIISHNHPHSNALPSPADVETTKQIFTALAHLNIKLLDHIIVSNEDNDCISMLQTPKYTHLFK